MQSMANPLLQLANVSKSFGGVHAVNAVSLQVEAGSIHGLIGPNGAGKSTLFHLVSGHLQPSQGEVYLDGRPVNREPPERRAEMGVAIAFQSARIFQGMTVLETVMVGAHVWARYGVTDALLNTRRFRAIEASVLDAARHALARVNLLERADDLASALPLGKQRQLQIARALCARPRLLLLDEPASGLRGEERAALAGLVRDVRAGGVTVVIVEHDVGFNMSLSDQVTVLELGSVIADAAPREIRRNQRVIQAYLGTEVAA
jgi:branched-chain amino acid transport system ATP-binding protein